MPRPLLEVIALTAQDAVAAQQGGADRLELVTGMDQDGLTPGPRTVAAVRAATTLPVRVMLRASAGFGAGGTDGVVRLCAAARELRAAGAREFVLGFLDPAGRVDVAAVRTVVEALDGAPWTFHRALDHSADRAAARRALQGLPGLDTVLTAGAPGGVADGLPVLRGEAAGAAPGRPPGPRLMAGGGLRHTQLPVLRAAGVDAFHIGSAARTGGSWSAPVTATAVHSWRRALDDVPVAG
ncbi:copper homeostasis protein CutC [Streptomyces carpaticus]|nr:copper homeostasis protein CutC [Streptomyces ginkgonis]UWM50585.1 copper homeostasis protein CutC [Streptomyces carpaticus]